MKTCFKGSVVEVSCESLTYSEKQILSAARVDSIMFQAGSSEDPDRSAVCSV